MGLSEQKGLHWGAAKWYYDLVANHGAGVPEAIVRHVRRCLVCRKQVERLKKAVTGADGEADSGRSDMKRDIIETLQWHFGCLQERVTCARVKPFLPGLLLSSVRIPTPITVHIDQCPECADDLAALRGLGLGEEQLERLERLYAGVAGQTPQRLRIWPAQARLCRRARARIAAFVRGELAGIDAKILDHLCTCPCCRPRVHAARQGLLSGDGALRELSGEACGRALGRPKDQGQSSLPVPAIACEGEVPMAWLFDYAVPFGQGKAVAAPGGVADGASGPPLEDPAPALRRALDAHVRTCPACWRRIQELDETIYGIAERTDCGIATVYSTIEAEGAAALSSRPSARAGEAARTTPSEATDVYASYPIRVQVLRGRPQPVAAAWKGASCNPRVRFLLKTAVAAAAMIPLAFIFLNTNTASGITLAQIYGAFAKAQNVHIRNFDTATGQVDQEFWIVREANSFLMARGQERTLYDLGAKKKRVGSVMQASTEIAGLSDAECANWRRFIGASLGFRLEEVPADAKWTPLRENAVEGTEVYELTYIERNRDGQTAFRKWRIVADSVTRLPREAQAFRKRSTEDQWRCQSGTEFRYPTQEEMAAILGSL